MHVTTATEPCVRDSIEALARGVRDRPGKLDATHRVNRYIDDVLARCNDRNPAHADGGLEGMHGQQGLESCGCPSPAGAGSVEAFKTQAPALAGTITRNLPAGNGNVKGKAVGPGKTDLIS